MIEITNTIVEGFEPALRGMRNSWNSWDKSDSANCEDILRCEDCRFADEEYNGTQDLGISCRNESKCYVIGKNDLTLMKKLVKAGTDHRKFLRMIAVWCDITAPLYWWKEFDTYKVGTVANSCSTMHCIADKEFTADDFSCEYLKEINFDTAVLLYVLNMLRKLYFQAKNTDTKQKYWYSMIQLLPSSYNQKRTVMLNYEVLMNMYKARKNHKLDEWREFCKWVEELPYMKELLEVCNAKKQVRKCNSENEFSQAECKKLQQKIIEQGREIKELEVLAAGYYCDIYGGLQAYKDYKIAEDELKEYKQSHNLD